MAKYLSQSQLDRFLRIQSKEFGKENLTAIVEKQRVTPLGRKREKSIFLSHSHNDKTIIQKIGLMFNHVDVNIYIDWMDDTMPQVPDHETAANIRRKIEHCNNFLFLATASGLKSRWCNWELGIAYSLKKKNLLAILPINSRSGNWRGNEYLQLYPEMEVDINELEEVDENKIRINVDTENSLTLEQWLK